MSGWQAVRGLDFGGGSPQAPNMSSPALAVDSNGNVLAAWAFGGGGGVPPAIRADILTAGDGAWAPFQTVFADGGGYSDVVAALADDGTALVVWGGGGEGSTPYGGRPRYADYAHLDRGWAGRVPRGISSASFACHQCSGARCPDLHRKLL